MKTLTIESEILNSLSEALPYLPCFFSDDVSFAITDRKKYLSVKQCGDLDLLVKPGDMLREGGATLEAMRTGKVIIKDVPKEIFGTPFKSYAVPVKEKNGQIVGAIVLGKSLIKREEMLSLSESLSDALSEISTSINELSIGVQNVVHMNDDILINVKEANDSTKDTNEILNFVKGVSSQTNLLGLNAAIEAARAGESGLGFNVVAKEIRKLATSSSESIKKVDKVLKNVEASIKTITGRITESSTIFQDQASTIQEIASSIEELSSKAEILEALSKKI